MNEIENEEKYERNTEIIKKVLNGVPMATVAREHNISKQRVDQIFKRGSKKDPELITLTEYCAKAKISKTFAKNLIKADKLSSEKIGNKYYIREGLEITRQCAYCSNRFTPSTHYRYCSEDCRDKALVSQRKRATWRRFNKLKKMKEKFGLPVVPEDQVPGISCI